MNKSFIQRRDIRVDVSLVISRAIPTRWRITYISVGTYGRYPLHIDGDIHLIVQRWLSGCAVEYATFTRTNCPAFSVVTVNVSASYAFLVCSNVDVAVPSSIPVDIKRVGQRDSVKTGVPTSGRPQNVSIIARNVEERGVLYDVPVLIRSSVGLGLRSQFSLVLPHTSLLAGVAPLTATPCE